MFFVNVNINLMLAEEPKFFQIESGIVLISVSFTMKSFSRCAEQVQEFKAAEEGDIF